MSGTASPGAQSTRVHSSNELPKPDSHAQHVTLPLLSYPGGHEDPVTLIDNRIKV